MESRAARIEDLAGIVYLSGEEFDTDETGDLLNQLSVCFRYFSAGQHSSGTLGQVKVTSCRE